MGLLDPPVRVTKSIAAALNADAFTDFTTKPNGDPPNQMDTGQAVDFLNDTTGAKAQIASGKLVHGTLPGSGSYAAYYQAQLDTDCRAAGVRWTVDSNGSSTSGVLAFGMWAGIYTPSVTQVPKTPAHIIIDTITGAWQWWVGDGLPASGASNLRNVKSGTFTPPASDGTAVWETAVYIDPDNGIGYLYLPGIDSATGTRYVTLTNAEIATFLTNPAVGLTAITFAQAISGANVLFLEHYANTAGNTARYPQVLSVWGETLRLSRDRSREMRQKSITPAAPVVARYDDTRVVTDGAIAASGTTLTSATAAFASTDAGRTVSIAGAGVAGAALTALITVYTNATTVTLGTAASTTVTGATVNIGSSVAARTKTATTTPASVFVDPGGIVPATIKAAAGPTGKIFFTLPSVYLEFKGSGLRTVTDGAITAASTTLTSATAAFVAADVGRLIVVVGAGASGTDLITRIASRTNATTVVLADAASTTVASAATVRISPADVLVYARMNNGTVSTLTCPIRGIAGDRWIGTLGLLVESLTPNVVSTWTFQLYKYSDGDGTAICRFAGASTSQQPPLIIEATPL